MFLNELNITEKSAFYSIATSLIAADGKIADQEASLLNQFLDEMRIAKSEIIPLDATEALYILSHSINSIKKKILIELVGLAMCDNEYDDTEKQLICMVAQGLNINSDITNQIEKSVFDLINVYRNIESLVAE